MRLQVTLVPDLEIWGALLFHDGSSADIQAAKNRQPEVLFWLHQIRFFSDARLKACQFCMREIGLCPQSGALHASRFAKHRAFFSCAWASRTP